MGSPLVWRLNTSPLMEQSVWGSEEGSLLAHLIITSTQRCRSPKVVSMRYDTRLCPAPLGPLDRTARSTLRQRLQESASSLRQQVEAKKQGDRATSSRTKGQARDLLTDTLIMLHVSSNGKHASAATRLGSREPHGVSEITLNKSFFCVSQ